MRLREWSTVAPKWLEATISAGSVDGLLFHGTLETFEGRIVASEWEGLRWFAEDAVVAQSYCAQSGGSWLWATPRHRLDERFMPDQAGPCAEVFAMMGHDAAALDIERDAHGRTVSYRVLDGHPTWRDAHRFVTETLGYEITDETCWIKTRGGRVMPRAWSQEGRLYILERPDWLRLHDMSDEGDDGLTGRQWMRTDRFKDIADDPGADGVVISDVHHSERLGHFGHRSIGLFDRTLERLRWHSIPCVSFDPAASWTDGMPTTPEFALLTSGCGTVADRMATS